MHITYRRVVCHNSSRAEDQHHLYMIQHIACMVHSFTSSLCFSLGIYFRFHPSEVSAKFINKSVYFILCWVHDFQPTAKFAFILLCFKLYLFTNMCHTGAQEHLTKVS